MTKRREELTVNGKDVVDIVKKIIKEGNARKIIIQNQNGKEMMTIPLTFAAVGTILAPVLAGIGAMAALIAKCKIIVIRNK